jgi:cytochrome P450
MIDVNQAAMMLFSPQGQADPYPVYALLREAAPVIKSPFGIYLVTRHELVDRSLRSAAFRTPRGYRDADDPAGPPRFDPAGRLTLHRRNWLLFAQGDQHTRLRKLIMKVFTPRAVRALAPRIEALVDALLAPALERGSMEVIADLAYPLPATVICELIGIPEAERELNRTWGEVVADTVDPMCTTAQIAAAEVAMREWDAYLRTFLAERRRAPGDGLVDAMLAVEEDGSGFTDDEISANMTFLFLAGHGTTTGLIGNGLYALLRHPEQLAKLHAEPGLVENAIEELLRFDSPVQFAPRVALERTEIAGVVLEPEIPVNLMLGCANRDPRKYERPDELDVTRPDPKPLAFGGGPHFCVGAALARFEAKAAFEKLVARTRSLELGATPKFRPGLALRSLIALPITFQRA